MSLPKRMKKRKLDDRELEVELGIPHNAEVTYSPADIKALEDEKLRSVRTYFRRKRWLESAN